MALQEGLGSAFVKALRGRQAGTACSCENSSQCLSLSTPSLQNEGGIKPRNHSRVGKEGVFKSRRGHRASAWPQDLQ